MAKKPAAAQPSFFQGLVDEIYDLNSRSYVRDVNLEIDSDLAAVAPHDMITPDISMGFVEGVGNPGEIISNEGRALRLTADGSISGSNWVSLETRIQPKSERSVLALRIGLTVDRTLYPRVFVRNIFTGKEYVPNRVAVFSPKVPETFLLINLEGSDSDQPHVLTFLFNKGPFDLTISSISYVSL